MLVWDLNSTKYWAKLPNATAAAIGNPLCRLQRWSVVPIVIHSHSCEWTRREKELLLGGEPHVTNAYFWNSSFYHFIIAVSFLRTPHTPLSRLLTCATARETTQGLCMFQTATMTLWGHILVRISFWKIWFLWWQKNYDLTEEMLSMKLFKNLLQLLHLKAPALVAWTTLITRSAQESLELGAVIISSVGTQAQPLLTGWGASPFWPLLKEAAQPGLTCFLMGPAMPYLHQRRTQGVLCVCALET